MSQDNDNNQNPPQTSDQSQNQEQTQAQNSAAEKAIAKIEAVKAAKILNNPDSEWTLLQEILQEIMATHTVMSPGSKVASAKLREELEYEVKSRFSDAPETLELLLNAIPTARAIRDWIKKDGWNDAVWAKIKREGLFTSEKRAEVIEAIRERAVKRSDNAAKLWLTMSGDYSDKVEVDNATVETYREINKILYNKKTDD